MTGNSIDGNAMDEFEIALNFFCCLVCAPFSEASLIAMGVTSIVWFHLFVAPSWFLFSYLNFQHQIKRKWKYTTEKKNLKSNRTKKGTSPAISDIHNKSPYTHKQSANENEGLKCHELCKRCREWLHWGKAVTWFPCTVRRPRVQAVPTRHSYVTHAHPELPIIAAELCDRCLFSPLGAADILIRREVRTDGGIIMN